MSYPPDEKHPECPYCQEYGIPACCLAILRAHLDSAHVHPSLIIDDTLPVEAQARQRPQQPQPSTPPQ